jgi:hypothetical protein
MSTEENFRKKNIELQTKVSAEIEKVNKGLSKKSIFQLQNIFKELCAMEMTKGLAVSYPRLIVDSWDYSDSLGLELMELADQYENENIVRLPKEQNHMFDLPDYMSGYNGICRLTMVKLLKERHIYIKSEKIDEMVQKVLNITYSIGGGFEESLLEEIAETFLFEKGGIQE